MTNPYEPSTVETAAPSQVRVVPGDYGGITRGQYFLFGFLVGLVQVFLDGPTPSGSLVGIVGFVVSLGLIFFRIINLGYSGLYFLLVFVPIVNILPLFQAAICPTGYAVTKKLDTIGTVLAGLILLAIALPLLFIFMSMPSE